MTTAASFTQNPAVAQTLPSGIAINYSWTYDRWGNRWSQTPQSGGLTESLTFDTTTNRINSAGFTYDPAGNVQTDGYHSYSYDADWNLTQIDGGNTATYTYDAQNQRVRIDGPGITKEFVFNPAGQHSAAWDLINNWPDELWHYWGAKPVEFDGNSQENYEHQDWIGTERMRTLYDGSVEGTFASLPFGDGLSTTGSDYDPYHFAGLDHDYESDTDHAQFRQYTSAAGRWMSPDPDRGSYDFSNPQSLNRYAYVLSNPLAFTDSLGLNLMDPQNSLDGIGGPDQQLPCTESNPCLIPWKPGDTIESLGPRPWLPSDDPDPNPGYGFEGLGGPGGGGRPDVPIDNPLGRALFTPQVGGRYFGAAYKAVEGGAIAYGAVFGGAALALGAGPLAATAGNRLLFGSALNRAFWSGAGYFGAQEYAEMKSGTTLEMTIPGKVLGFLTKPRGGGFGFDWSTMQPWWRRASAAFANGAEGPVLRFQDLDPAKGDIWNTVESVILAGKGITVYQIPF